MLLQNVRFDGPLGALVAIVILFTVLVTAIKGGQWLWQNIGKKLINKINRARVRDCEREMLAFWQGFFDHRRFLILILNDKKECIYISTALAQAWGTDFHSVEGRKWRRVHKESTLDRYLAKLRDAYETQSPFVQPVTILNGVEATYLAKGEPYISRNEVRYFVISMERMENLSIMREPKQLEA